MRKKLLATLLSLAMVFSLLPTWAIAEGEEPAPNGSNAETPETEYVAKIGDEEYETLAAAYAALPRNVAADSEPTTITLLKDCVGGGIGNDTDKGMNYVIDFGGYTYTVGEPPVGSTGYETQGFRVLQGNKAEFKNGTLKAADYNAMMQVVHTYGDVTFTDFTVDATEDPHAQIAVEADCGTLNVCGDSSILAYEGKTGLYVAFWHYGTYDGTIVNVDTTGDITGKLVYEFDERKPGGVAATENKGILNITNGNFQIDGLDVLFSNVENETLKVANISITGGTFSDLSALDYLADNADVTIKLEKDETPTRPFDVKGEVTLDLNGHTVKPVYTQSANSADGILYKADYVFAVLHGGKLTVNATNGGTIDASGITAATGSQTALKLTKLGDAVEEYTDTNKAVLVVNGGTITSPAYGISGNGNKNRGNAEVVVNGGTISGTAAAGIYNPQYGALTINGGEISGANGVYVKSGNATVSMTGGSISTTSTEPSSYSYDGDGVSATGYAFAVDNANYPGGEPTVAISDGTFDGPVESFYKEGKDRITGFITGGTFNTQPDETLLATGYGATKNADGTWTVARNETTPTTTKVAKIGDVEYATLAEAFEAANKANTATVTMVADTEITFDTTTYAKVETDDNITLDLNGKVITSVATNGGTSQLIENLGGLTIRDSAGEVNGHYTGKIIHGASPAWVYDGSGSYNGSYASSLILNYGGTVTIESGYLENASLAGQTGSAAYVVDNNNNVATGATSLVINGGEIVAAWTAIRQFVQRTDKENNVTVNGGSITAGRNCFMLNASALNIAKLTINGGTFVTNRNGNSGTSATIQLWQAETVTTKMAVEVKGGNFAATGGGTQKIVELDFTEDTTGSEAKKAIQITGGCYNLNDVSLTNYIAPGYECVENDDPATSATYGYKVVKAKVPVVVPTETPTATDDGQVTIGAEGNAQTVEIKVKTGEEAEATKNENKEVAQKAAEEIKTLLNNTEVTTFAETKIETATEVKAETREEVDGFNISMILNAIKEAAKDAGKNLASDTVVDSGAKASGNDEITVSNKPLTDTDVTKTIKIDLTSAEVTTTTDTGTQTVVKLSETAYDVKPIATITVTTAGGGTETVTAVIPNDAITAPITFRLPVPAGWGDQVKVYHEDELKGVYKVLGEGDDRYVELESKTFSVYTLQQVKVGEVPEDEALIAQVGDNMYTDLYEAVEAALESNETLVLLADTDFGETDIAIPESKQLKIDLNSFNWLAPFAEGSEERVVLVNAPEAPTITVTTSAEGNEVLLGDTFTVTLKADKSWTGATISFTVDDHFALVDEGLPAGWTEEDGVYTYNKTAEYTAENDFASFTLKALSPTEGAVAPLSFTTKNVVLDAAHAASALQNVSTLVASVNCAKVTVIGKEFGEVTVTDNAATYDKALHTFTLNIAGLDAGVIVTKEYQYGGFTGEDWTTDEPSSTDAVASYAVKWRISAPGYITKEGDYSTFEVKPFKLTTDMATVTAKGDLLYNGDSYDLVTTALKDNAPEGTKIMFEGSDGSWTEAIPVGTDADEYTLTYKLTVPGNGNYADSDTATVSATISEPSKVVYYGAYGEGYNLVLVFTNDAAKWKYGDQVMFDVNALGYKYGSVNEDGIASTLVGTDEDGYESANSAEHVYAWVVTGEVINLDTNLKAVSAKTSAKKIALSSSASNGDVKLDVNRTHKIDIADAVVVWEVSDVDAYYYDKISGRINFLLLSDIDRNGDVDIDDANTVLGAY